MSSFTGLPAIITAARAGALEHAEQLFEASGLGRRGDDPAVLAVRGRLLKDRAARLPPAEQPQAFARAAAAYAAADAIVAQPYTRINIATLTMLAGEREEACRIASQIIDWIAADGSIRETPFYLAATRAEAHMLCGAVAEATQALRDAVKASPLAFEDRAATLRQFELIGRTMGQDLGWLEEFRPPRSLHFAGHMGVEAQATPALVDEIDAILEREQIGFAFGALAAGADLLIAERIVARGGELHVVLPLSTGAFMAQSVAPYGDEWLAGFEACREAAASWTETACDTGDYEPLATDLAADVAMGSAVRHARQVAGEAVQLVIVDEGPGDFGEGKQTARDARRWQATGRRSHVVRAPRRPSVVASGRRRGEGRPDRRLAAMLQLDFAGMNDLDETSFARCVDDLLIPLRETMSRAEPSPQIVLPCGNSRIVAFASPELAHRFARDVLRQAAGLFPLRIAGHYGLAHWLTGPDALVGRSIGELNAIAQSTIPGTLTVSESFASALFLATPEGLFAEPVGEAGELRLFAVRGLDQ